MEQVKRVILIAAGYGSRMNPITLTTPKPLVKVNGIRIIDTLIDAFLEKGIKEIIVVRGYLKEQFDVLLEKYPMIKFVDNDTYDYANNIGSIYLVRDLLENAYISEADLLLSNKDVISLEHDTSDFLGFKVDKTDDWCFDNKDNIITDLHKGGTNCFQEIGISYWNKEDGRKLSKDIEETYNNDKNLFWEEVPLTIYKDRYRVHIRECNIGDVVEIDTFEELCKIDRSYKALNTTK